MANNELYDMKLHDVMEMPGYFRALRVPGGWVYSDYLRGGSCFVPFDNEFYVNSNKVEQIEK